MSSSTKQIDETEGAGRENYQRKVRQIQSQWPQRADCPVVLAKTTSNLFRDRKQTAVKSVDMSMLNQLIAVDPAQMMAEVEGMITYEQAVAALLPYGFMPAVVPELKTITVGGAIAGGGIESSSFRYGFVHETVEEMDILLADGTVVTARADNEYADLFCGFPCTYGTLGYVLRARIRIQPVTGFVKLEHHRFNQFRAAADFLSQECSAGRQGSGPDFIEAVVFAQDSIVVTCATHQKDKPAELSDYTKSQIYYRSLLNRDTDYLTTKDYIWRWDTDWFWCARAFGSENRLLRWILARAGLLRSSFYWKLRAQLKRWGVVDWLERRNPQEYVIQDVEIPAERAEEFVDFFLKEIPLLPFWICPAQSPPQAPTFPIYQTDPDCLYFNFGFWGGVPAGTVEGQHNMRVEEKVTELDGKKSLYSESFYTREAFWNLYNGSVYFDLKQKYDAQSRFLDLYAKCVERH